MGHVSVTLNSLAVQGALVTVTGATVLFGIGGFSGRALTDSKGVADIPDPSLSNFPQGSVADVDVTYTDAQGKRYAGTASWSVVSDWNLATGFEGWSPEPLTVGLLPVEQIDSGTLTQIQKNQSNQLNSDNSTSLSALTSELVWVVAAILVVYLFVNLFGRRRA